MPFSYSNKPASHPLTQGNQRLAQEPPKPQPSSPMVGGKPLLHTHAHNP